MSTSRLSHALPLKHFIRRQQSIQLYRNFMRALRDIDPDMRASIKNEIQIEFRINVKISNELTIKMLLANGRRSLKQLIDLRVSNLDEDSWISVKDSDDKRGRVGTGWPWGN